MARTPSEFRLDKSRVRASFARAAGGYDAHAGVQREVAERLLEHLAPVRIEPRRILDVGTGTGGLLGHLARRHRRAEIVALDLAPAMLREARRRAPRLFSRRRFLCGDMEALPLASASVDLVVSNATLQWSSDPDRAFAELARVLRPGGLLLFSSFGPDTLRELRVAWAAVDPRVHVHAFADMHDVGDALVRAGLADVVMDVERIRVHYPTLDALLRALRGLGVTNAARGRPRGLGGRRRLDALREAYEAQREGSGLPATFEAVFAHAWQSPESSRPGSVDVGIDGRESSPAGAGRR